VILHCWWSSRSKRPRVPPQPKAVGGGEVRRGGRGDVRRGSRSHAGREGASRQGSSGGSGSGGRVVVEIGLDSTRLDKMEVEEQQWILQIHK